MQLASDKFHDILFSEIPGKGGNLGLITLNRPHVLNALNEQMVVELVRQLEYWRVNDNIKAVVITATKGRAFCAGGDLRQAYLQASKDSKALAGFFMKEYYLNKLIHDYPKPYIALLSGITMGGGAGISLHGAHRIATEDLIFAMPETGIGFFPDVGATYFLSRLPGELGKYIGLTGERLNYSDCYAIGLIDYVVNQESFNALIDQLVETKFANDVAGTVAKIVKEFSITVPCSSLITKFSDIDKCYSLPSIEAIMRALQILGTDWSRQIYAVMDKRSPTSLKITLQQLKLGKTLAFDQCIELECYLASRFVDEHDFVEGIRAVLIDKDHSPRWQPKSLHEVTYEKIMNYFPPHLVGRELF